MKIVYPLLLSALLFAVLCTVGCTAPSGTAAQPVTSRSTAVAADADQMYLSLSDLPAGFFIAERREKNASEVSDLARDLGWKKGYIARFERDQGPLLPATEIMQSIAIYPAKNIARVTGLVRKAAEGGGRYTVIPLPDPGTGNSGFAVAVYEAGKENAAAGDKSIIANIFELQTTVPVRPGQMPASQKPLYYEIAFTEGEVFEAIRMSGPSADCGTLENLARVAYGKVR